LIGTISNIISVSETVWWKRKEMLW